MLHGVKVVWSLDMCQVRKASTWSLSLSLSLFSRGWLWSLASFAVNDFRSCCMTLTVSCQALHLVTYQAAAAGVKTTHVTVQKTQLTTYYKPALLYCIVYWYIGVKARPLQVKPLFFMHWLILRFWAILLPCLHSDSWKTTSKIHLNGLCVTLYLFALQISLQYIFLKRFFSTSAALTDTKMYSCIPLCI